METCKTCKHWDNKADNHQVGSGNGICKNTPMHYSAYEWCEDVDSDLFCTMVVKSEYKNNKAFVQDASDYHAILITMPDFGCNQHTAIGKEEL